TSESSAVAQQFLEVAARKLGVTLDAPTFPAPVRQARSDALAMSLLVPEFQEAAARQKRGYCYLLLRRLDEADRAGEPLVGPLEPRFAASRAPLGRFNWRGQPYLSAHHAATRLAWGLLGDHKQIRRRGAGAPHLFEEDLHAICRLWGACQGR